MTTNNNILNKKFPLNSHPYHATTISLKRAEKNNFNYETLDFKANPNTTYSPATTAMTVPKASNAAATTTGTSKTIMITNNYNTQGLKTTHRTTNNKTIDNIVHHDGNNLNANSSITIVTSPGNSSTTNVAPNATVVLDRINICINNHFNDPVAAAAASSEPKTVTNGDEAGNERKHSTAAADKLTSEADSTSHLKVNDVVAAKVATFNVHEDVLLKKADDRFYLGTIVAIVREKCLIQFDDNTEQWSPFEVLKKFSSSTETERAPLCVVCKKSDADTVEVCEKCGRGYHKKCTDGECEKNGIWTCKRCTTQNGMKNNRLLRADIRRICSGVESNVEQDVVTELSQLPYDINALNWDPYHRVNMEQIYCYCGKNGEWYLQMLQCWRCQQWYHEKCVRCLSSPLYYGDRFFVFVCSACNEGTEFIRRLELTWADIIHLLIFNLTVNTSSKYHDLTKVIIPYIEDNLFILHIPPQSLNMSVERRKELICSIINSDKTRFKCGREIKKNSNLFGLRSRIPPQAPTILMPTDGPKVEELYLKSYLPNEIRFLSEKDNLSIKYDQNICYKMSGKAYESCNSDDDESTLFDAHLEFEDEIPVTFVIGKDKMGAYNGCQKFQRPADDEPYVPNLFSLEPSMGTCIRNLFPRQEDEPAAKEATNSSLSHNQLSSSMSNLLDVSFDSDKSHGDNSSKSAENSKDGFVNSVNSFKAASVSGGGQSRRRRMRQRSQSQNITRVKRENSLDICDSSGDDDASSRSTLDLIIPPPKNFRGTNNPFHKQNLKSTANEKASKLSIGGYKNRDANPPKHQKEYKRNSNVNNSRKDTLYLHKQFNIKPPSVNSFNGSQQHPNQLRIVRTVKRRLSAKDLVIGPNMEVKRRKLGKKSGNSDIISTTIHSTSYVPTRSDNRDRNVRTSIGGSSASSSGLSTPLENAPHIPPPPPSTISQRLTKTINGRRLRHRQEKNYCDNRRSSIGLATPNGLSAPGCSSSSNLSLPCSPNKGGSAEEELSLSDLQSSLQVYIGAGSRIASGEQFRVCGKRVSMDGRQTYLLEWEGGVSSLL